MPSPIAIRNAFEIVAEEMYSPEAVDREQVAEAVNEKIAGRYGVSLGELIEAVSEELATCIGMLVNAGPQRAFITAQIMGFLSGVRWEQGRHPDASSLLDLEAVIESLQRYPMYGVDSGQFLVRAAVLDAVRGIRPSG